MNLIDLLYECFRHFYHLDHSNAAVHVAPVRYSPITFRLAEAIDQACRVSTTHLVPSNQVYPDVYSVILDLGSYEEDPGR